ncbi:hypothetical protein BV22DRAFT_1036625, partial [Leucogyrophana mollusca]
MTEVMREILNVHTSSGALKMKIGTITLQKYLYPRSVVRREVDTSSMTGGAFSIATFDWDHVRRSITTGTRTTWAISSRNRHVKATPIYDRNHGLFYAYAKNANDDVTWRYLIVFASRAVADEWWRAVSESSNTWFSSSIKRITPQLYTHNRVSDDLDICQSITTQDVAPGFLNKVFFTLLNDRDGGVTSIIPSQDITDHVSGNSFLIRSKANPSEYWYCPTTTPPSDTWLYVSREARTRFCVCVLGPTSDRCGTIMIGSDKILITVSSDNRTVTTFTAYDQKLVARIGSADHAFKFENFENGFRAGPVEELRVNNLTGLKKLLQTNAGDGEE